MLRKRQARQRIRKIIEKQQWAWRYGCCIAMCAGVIGLTGCSAQQNSKEISKNSTEQLVLEELTSEEAATELETPQQDKSDQDVSEQAGNTADINEEQQPTQETEPQVSAQQPSQETEPQVPAQQPSQQAESQVQTQQPIQETEPQVPVQQPSQQAEAQVPEQQPSQQAETQASVQQPSQETEAETSAPSKHDKETTEQESEEMEEKHMNIQVGDITLTVTLADNSSAEALAEYLKDGPVTLSLDDYAGMEKVGDLGTSLPRNDKQINTSAGDIILYQGRSFVIYYDTNSWSLTRLGKIDNMTAKELRKLLGSGSVEVTLSL